MNKFNLMIIALLLTVIFIAGCLQVAQPTLDYKTTAHGSVKPLAINANYSNPEANFFAQLSTAILNSFKQPQ